MDPVQVAVLVAGALFLVFGLVAYRYFYSMLGATAGLVLWMALSDTLLNLPGLREHPGTAGVLILILLVLAGVFLASKFRRALVFAGGFGTGLVLSQILSGFMSGDSLAGVSFRVAHIDLMDFLAGLVCGLLFVLFERFFAVLLTSVAGSFLCAWAIGGKWTFPLCLLAGLVAQPLVSLKFKSSPKPSPGKERTGTITF